MAYFRHAGLAQPLTHKVADYLSGDLVAWDLGGGVLHIRLVSDRKAVTGVPRMIHNIGAGAREENILFRYAIIGHFGLEAPR